MEAVCSREVTVGSNPTLSAMFHPRKMYRHRMADRVGEDPRLGFRERGTRELTAFEIPPCLSSAYT